MLLKTVMNSGGWFSDADCMDANKVVGGNYDFPAAGMILYAKWSVVTYSIEYHAPGATLSGEYTKNYTVEDDIINVPDASLEGYEFNGWFVEPHWSCRPLKTETIFLKPAGLCCMPSLLFRSYTDVVCRKRAALRWITPSTRTARLSLLLRLRERGIRLLAGMPTRL